MQKVPNIDNSVYHQDLFKLVLSREIKFLFLIYFRFKHVN